MQHDVFIEPVRTEVELDRRLRRGDTLIAESRDAVRDGEIVIVESDTGPCVGRYASGDDEIVLYPLTPTAIPTRVRREELHVRGVVIGVKSSL